MNNQINQDTEHLKILSICHYVLAGLCIFPLLYGVFYMAMGIFFGVMIAKQPQPKDAPPPELFTGIFVGIGLVVTICSIAYGIALLKAGKNLKSGQSYTFCLVVACISCIFMPFGTVLGIFTIIVLMRDSVKAFFNSGSPTQFGNTPPDWK